MLDAGAVEIIHVETTGWQLSQTQALGRFFSELGDRVQGFDTAHAPKLEKQAAKNMAMGANVNLMQVIAEAHRTGQVQVRNLFMNTFTPSSIEPYSVIHLEPI